MSAPAALAVSKIVYPETEIEIVQNDKAINAAMANTISGDEINFIEAAANGAMLAVALVANIVAVLIAFLAILSALDALIAYLGSLAGWPEASFEFLCGYLFFPVALVMRVPLNECHLIGRLLGLKNFANEFVAYVRMAELRADNQLSERSVLISTYALCGFSNLASIGVQLGGLTPLAPSRKSDLARVGFSAMVAGNIACFMKACIAGILYDVVN